MNTWKITAIIALIALAVTFVYFLGFDQGGTALSLSGTNKVESKSCLIANLPGGSLAKLTGPQTEELIDQNQNGIVISKANGEQLQTAIKNIIDENPNADPTTMSSNLALRILFEVCCSQELECCNIFPPGFY